MQLNYKESVEPNLIDLKYYLLIHYDSVKLSVAITSFFFSSTGLRMTSSVGQCTNFVHLETTPGMLNGNFQLSLIIKTLVMAGFHSVEIN